MWGALSLSLSLTRGQVCRLQLLLASPAQSFLGPSPVGLATIFYCLRLETSLLSPSTTRRVTVEVFDPASIWDNRDRVRVRVRVRVTLRLAVYRQSIRLGVEPLETYVRLFSQLNTCRHSPYITSSLTRGWVCHLQLLLALSSAFILGFEFRGGIRPCLHTR
jgi:hypothetical protein